MLTPAHKSHKRDKHKLFYLSFGWEHFVLLWHTHTYDCSREWLCDYRGSLWIFGDAVLSHQYTYVLQSVVKDVIKDMLNYFLFVIWMISFSSPLFWQPMSNMSAWCCTLLKGKRWRKVSCFMHPASPSWASLLLKTTSKWIWALLPQDKT